MVSQIGHSVLQRSLTLPKMNCCFSSIQPEKNATRRAAWAKNRARESAMRHLALLLASIVALCACGGEKPRPEKPFILADRASLGFGLENGQAVYIGTRPQQSLQISNEGLQDLNITDITLSGDN